MSELTGDLRLLIEQIIDGFIKDPNVLTTTKETLRDMGIQPNLETTLAYITGQVEGAALGAYLVKKYKDGKKSLIDSEYKLYKKEVKELLTRRAMELRQHFVQSEYM